MKKILIALIVIVGVGGLIALLSYHPSTANSTTTPLVATSNVDTGTQSTPTPITSATTYKDGTYTGTAVDNDYGVVQVAAVISGGKISSVKFLQMPSDQQHSREVTAFAEPSLKQETIQAQSAQVDLVSGATQTSEAFIQSMQAALAQAHA